MVGRVRSVLEYAGRILDVLLPFGIASTLEAEMYVLWGDGDEDMSKKKKPLLYTAPAGSSFQLQTPDGEQKESMQATANTWITVNRKTGTQTRIRVVDMGDSHIVRWIRYFRRKFRTQHGIVGPDIVIDAAIKASIVTAPAIYAEATERGLQTGVTPPQPVWANVMSSGFVNMGAAAAASLAKSFQGFNTVVKVQQKAPETLCTICGQDIGPEVPVLVGKSPDFEYAHKKCRDGAEPGRRLITLED